MVETEAISAVYIYQAGDAILKFIDNSIIYSNTFQEMSSKKKVEDEILPGIQQAVNYIRYFEKHAFFRVKVISEIVGFSIEKIENGRGCLKEKVPSAEKVEELAMDYNRLLSTKISLVEIRTPQQTVSEITGSL